MVSMCVQYNGYGRELKNARHKASSSMIEDVLLGSSVSEDGSSSSMIGDFKTKSEKFITY